MKNMYFENLKTIFELNFEVTRMYSTYLEKYPELITGDMIEELRQCGVEPRDAIVAIFSELFSLDTEVSAHDRRLMREYLYPSVRMLDAEKYRSNPYYKNVKLENTRLGNWEIKLESYPAYRGVICSDMIIKNDFTEIPPLGFFAEEFSFPAVLEGGNEWMTLTPVDLDTCQAEIDAAFGDVITFGLGLGYYAYMVSEKPEVKKITVVEKSPEVIELFKKCILPYFNHPEKLEIIEADAFLFAEREMPKRHFDIAFVDTWRDAGDGAPMYCRMKPLEALNPGVKFYYWIENFIISRLRAIKLEELNMLNSMGRLTMSREEIINELTQIDRLIK